MREARLLRVERGGIACLTDPRLRDDAGILVAFSERIGGTSAPPYASLDLADHVGDDPAAVDANRTALLGSLGLARLRDRLTAAEQVHGSRIAEVDASDAGSGAFATGGRPKIPATDALLTAQQDLPLLMLFADCVPVVLVATRPVRCVGIAHCGWKGTLARVAAATAVSVAERSGCDPSDLRAYIGPRIGGCHYEVGPDVLSRFAGLSGTMLAAQGRVDLADVVSESLSEVGLLPDSVVDTGICTVETTGSYFSYRAEGVTGRHGALAVILGRTP